MDINWDDDETRSSAIMIDACMFFTSVDATQGTSYYAIQATNCSALWITNNNVQQLQIKLDKQTPDEDAPIGIGGPGYFILNNYLSGLPIVRDLVRCRSKITKPTL